MKMAISGSLRLSIFFISCLIATFLCPSSAIPDVNSPELATQVCKNTTNFSFCQAAVYSDPRAPKADRYLLSYVVFELAYRNATNTSNYIDILLKSMNGHADPEIMEAMKKCQGDYMEAIKTLSEALTDLDSETFDGLVELATDVENSAHDCEAGFNGKSPISEKNQNLIQLSNICYVVSELYTVSE
ncbi:cell wall / vacuolar inhibitor of fructosidase 2-like [Olea europaea var. sylvestris]|uniref:cell wall / vacuolar inhibitor of fructosidase 2-like n=1 Tax=Olea europaea var. sylvestris TaxID=158386 RepID=UPI000C1D38C2|nr:cell wall / vacuolar inhibitor of fructosidase 2-like [Olea europaea var. sylvestris]